MSNIMIPEKRPGMTQQILPVAGSVVGAAYGGPAGGAVGGLVGQKLAGSPKQAQPIQTQTAIQRRIDSQNGQEDPLKDLQAADQALAAAPPELQQQYGPAIRRARMLEEQNRGIA